MGPVAAARHGTYSEFMEVYDGSDIQKNIDTFLAGFAPLLWQSVSNKDVDARVAISNQLIDDGVDVPYVDNKTNVLTVFLSSQNLVPVKDAPLLRRIIQHGADMNFPSGGKGNQGGYTPAMLLLDNMSLTEEEKVPLYDVLLEFPEFHYRLPDGELRWDYNPVLTERIELHETRTSPGAG